VPALALLAVGWAATLWLSPFSDERVNDLFVYRSFADPVLHGQLPYRDVFFEYPPLAAPAIALPGVLGTGADAFRWAFAGWTFLLAAAVVLLCGALATRTRGDARRAMFAAALMPLACGAMVRTHFDLAPVALTLAALALIVSARPRLGLAVLGLGVATKVFPVVVAPVAIAWLAGRGQRREALQGALALVAVVAVTGLAAVAVSPGGFGDAISYQLDRPVQVESTAASVLLGLDAAGLGEARSVNSHRSDGLEHPADGAVGGALLAALLLAIATTAVAVGRTARADDGRRLVLASLAVVLAFAVLGRVLSPQYLIWTVPLAALAFAWRMHALAAAVTAAIVLTQVEFPSRYFDVVGRETFPVLLVAARNVALLVGLGLALRALVPSPIRREQQLLDRRRAPVVAGLDQHRA
jgi:hypothetical protein